jgi:hypothetical protein
MANTSSSFGGILRARHDRVPHNTPVQNVRFLDSPRTEYLRRKAQEQVRGPIDDRRTPEPLPPAQITQSSRWTRLGEILHLIENEDRHESDVAPLIEPSTPPLARSARSSKYSTASSPISFARFDPPAQPLYPNVDFHLSHPPPITPHQVPRRVLYPIRA